MEVNTISEKRLMPHIDYRYPRRPFPFLNKWECLLDEKIVFLNKKTLEKLEGYKATVELKTGVGLKREIHIIITGFSVRSSKVLFDSLEAMKKEEIHGR